MGQDFWNSKACFAEFGKTSFSTPFKIIDGETGMKTLLSGRLAAYENMLAMPLILDSIKANPEQKKQPAAEAESDISLVPLPIERASGPIIARTPIDRTSGKVMAIGGALGFGASTLAVAAGYISGLPVEPLISGSIILGSTMLASAVPLLTMHRSQVNGLVTQILTPQSNYGRPAIEALFRMKVQGLITEDELNKIILKLWDAISSASNSFDRKKLIKHLLVFKDLAYSAFKALLSDEKPQVRIDTLEEIHDKTKLIGLTLTQSELSESYGLAVLQLESHEIDNRHINSVRRFCGEDAKLYLLSICHNTDKNYSEKTKKHAAQNYIDWNRQYRKEDYGDILATHELPLIKEAFILDLTRKKFGKLELKELRMLFSAVSTLQSDTSINRLISAKTGDIKMRIRTAIAKATRSRSTRK